MPPNDEDAGRHDLAELVYHLPVGVFRTTPSGQVLAANIALARLFGIESPEDLVGRNALEFYPDPEERARITRRLVEEGIVRAHVHLLLRADGSRVWVRESSRAVRGADGEIAYHEGILEDVTEARAAEEALRISEADNRALAQNIPDLMFRFDASGVVRAYRAGDVGLVMSPEAFLGKRVEEFLPDLAEQTYIALNHVLRTGETYSYEYYLEVEGEERHYEARFTRVADNDVLCLIRDDTAQHRVREQLEQLVQAKDEFVAAISHELRNPLTSVVGLAEELRDNADQFTPAETRSFVRLIAEQARDMQDLVDDLLVAARADVGMVAVDRREIDLFGEVEGVLAAFPKGSAVLLPSGEGVKAYADPFRVRQIMRNLVSNAARYGGPDVEVEVASELGGATVQVRDNGEPVPEDEWELLFDTFHVAGSGDVDPPSVGLGLAVSRTLARLMDGDVTYRYENGMGVFELSLPGG